MKPVTELRNFLKENNFSCQKKSKHEQWKHLSSNDIITLSYGSKMSYAAIKGAKLTLKRMYQNGIISKCL